MRVKISGRRRRSGVTALVVAACAACAATPQDTSTAMPAGAIHVDAVAVPLNPDDPAMMAVGEFLYAGGLHLTSGETNLLHGLSDLLVSDAGRLTAVGDEGVRFDAQLVFDDAERLVGVEDAHLERLIGEHGRPLVEKVEADAEGLAELANGDRLVSFERDHRILLYPAAGGPPRRVPAPGTGLSSNSGMEALAVDPDAGVDAYLTGIESTGATWTCRLASDCTPAETIALTDGFGLVAMDRLPGARMAYLLRAFDPIRGNRVSLQVVDQTGVISRLDIVSPMTVDNFEGLAAVPQPDGAVRFYLISDDNVSAAQRTLLLAFDWQPSTRR
jgi:hypothetical protein